MKKNDLLPPDEEKMPEPKPDSDTSDSKDPSVGKPDNIESDKKEHDLEKPERPGSGKPGVGKPDQENPNKKDFDNEKNSLEKPGEKETDGNHPMHVFAPGFSLICPNEYLFFNLYNFSERIFNIFYKHCMLNVF